MFRRNFALIVSTLLGFALLTGLGLWQLQRLSWKEALIAQIAARRDMAPTPLPPQSQWSRLKPEDYDYRRVTLHGVYDHAHEAYLFRASPTGAAGEGPGYEVLTPLRLTTGGVVIVNRGFVPAEKKDPAARPQSQPAGDVAVTGLMRPPELRNFFTPPDEPAKNLWFTRDIAAIAAQAGLTAAPFAIDADATPNPGGWPKGGATVFSIPNNHLSYALTWFALAATLLAVSILFGWSREKRFLAKPKGQNANP